MSLVNNQIIHYTAWSKFYPLKIGGSLFEPREKAGKFLCQENLNSHPALTFVFCFFFLLSRWPWIHFYSSFSSSVKCNHSYLRCRATAMLIWDIKRETIWLSEAANVISLLSAPSSQRFKGIQLQPNKACFRLQERLKEWGWVVGFSFLVFKSRVLHWLRCPQKLRVTMWLIFLFLTRRRAKVMTDKEAIVSGYSQVEDIDHFCVDNVWVFVSIQKWRVSPEYHQV